MGLKEQLQEDKRLSLKQGDKERMMVLGVLLGEVDRIEPTITNGVKLVPDDSIIMVIKKMVENNKITNCEDENHILEQYLPRILNEEETEFAVQDIINSIGATSMKDMGTVMGEMKKQHGATIDGRLTSGIVKKILG